MEAQRIKGTEADEVLYADDTICLAQSAAAMNRLLAAIEAEGASYGMKLNKTNCEYLPIGATIPVRFRDGSKVPRKDEVKYLGCLLNPKGDAAPEVQKRITDCHLLLKRLHIFFRNADNTTRRKLQVFIAVVRSKLVYGLQTIMLNSTLFKKLDSFQMLSFRQILRVPTTFVDRTYSNAWLLNEINSQLSPSSGKEMKLFSEYHKEQRRQRPCKLICLRAGDPAARATFDWNTLLPHDYGKLRVGRPRLQWLTSTLEDLW